MRILHDPDYKGLVRGFTTAEALVSTLIVAVAVIAVFAGITASFDRVRSARQSARATQLMVERMEAIRVLTWSQLNSNGFIPARFTVPYVPGASQGPAFSGTCIVSPATNVSAPYGQDLRRINVTLTANWTKPPRTWNMTSYYARNGMQTYVVSH